jgi:hypothetical protein
MVVVDGPYNCYFLRKQPVLLEAALHYLEQLGGALRIQMHSVRLEISPGSGELTYNVYIVNGGKFALKLL